jgi:hypothetical protein
MKSENNVNNNLILTDKIQKKKNLILKKYQKKKKQVIHAKVAGASRSLKTKSKAHRPSNSCLGLIFF